MTEQHPITPPPELIEDWIEIAKPLPQRPPNPGDFATLAAQWGADQELDACIGAILAHPGFKSPELFVELLRAARRPKPPSLKEQALRALERIEGDAIGNMRAWAMHDDLVQDAYTIRRALEALDD